MNVFLVMSPLQLLNALEAKHHFGTERATLVVLRKTAQGYTLRDFRRLVRASDWSAVHYLSVLGEHEQRQSLSRWGWYAKVYRLRRRLDHLAARLGETERLFLGNYLEPLARHFANRLPHRQTVLLDDGTATLHVRRLREVEEPTLPRTRAALINRCLGFDERQDARVTYFTTYALSEYGDDEVIQHRYAHLGSLAVTRGGGRERLFLGQTLIEDGVVTKADYFRALEQIKRFYLDRGGAPLVYVPHSREDPAHVREIAQTFGFPVRRFDYPFEHQFTVEGTPLPTELSSFFCSALENARLLFGARLGVTAFRLESTVLQRDHLFIEDVYDYFEAHQSEAFRLVTLDLEASPQPVQVRTGASSHEVSYE